MQYTGSLADGRSLATFVATHTPEHWEQVQAAERQQPLKVRTSPCVMQGWHRKLQGASSVAAPTVRPDRARAGVRMDRVLDLCVRACMRAGARALDRHPRRTAASQENR